MKAVVPTPDTSTRRLTDRPKRAVTPPDDVKVRALRVGICGTDREEASGGSALASQGRRELVIGHEMFEQVVETGNSLYRVNPETTRCHGSTRMRRSLTLGIPYSGGRSQTASILH
jgi:threonine dehydrogenase-like Zn-dependent dehydrogenase